MTANIDETAYPVEEPEHLDKVFGEYIDRLNAGELVDASEIREAHPEFAEALLERLRAFQGLGDETTEGSVAGFEGGQTFGVYRILRELGRGGMGVVYEALDTSLERAVALKILPAGMIVDSRSVERFQREARIVGKLRHPGIVAIHSSGIEKDTPYFAMEFVEGETLDKVLERKRPKPPAKPASLLGKLSQVFTTAVEPVSSETATGPVDVRTSDLEHSPESAAEDEFWSNIPTNVEDMDLGYCIRMAGVFAEVSEALEHAHSRDIIHRDLKPSNLILDREGKLRVLDFGLARLDTQDREKITASGEILGTPRYMSPEQVLAQQNRIDHRTDIYSLGATLYEVLSLAPPFEARTAQDTLSRILHHEPRPLRQLNSRVPRDLETIVMKCLRKRVEDRYATAAALTHDLRSFARGDPIQARPMTFSERMALLVKRHKGKMAASAAILLLLLTVIWFAQKSAELSRVQRLQRYEQVVTESARKLQVHGALFWTTGAFAWGGSVPEAATMGQGLYDSDERVAEIARSLEEVVKLFPERPDGHYHLANAYYIESDYVRSLKELDFACERDFVPAIILRAIIAEELGDKKVAKEMLSRLQGSKGSSWAKTWHAAYVATEEKRWDDAAQAYEELIDVSRREGEQFQGEAVENYMGCGMAYLEAGEFEKARAKFSSAEALQPDALEPGLFQGFTDYLAGDIERAEKRFKTLAKKHPGEKDDIVNYVVLLCWARFHDMELGLEWTEELPAGFWKEFWLCSYHSRLGNHQECMEAGLKLPELNPRAPLSYFLASMSLLRSKRFDEALTMIDQAIALAPRNGSMLLLKAGAIQAKGDYMQAYALILKANELEPDSPSPYYYMGLIANQRGDIPQSVEHLRKCLDRLDDPFNAHIPVDDAFLMLARNYQRIGQPENAIATLEEAMEGDKLIEPWKLNIPLALARALDRESRVAEAASVLEKVLDDRPLDPVYLPRVHAYLGDLTARLGHRVSTYRTLEVALNQARRVELIPDGAEWKFFRGKSSPSPAQEWTRLDFDDASWEAGPSGFGYGDDDDATELDDMLNHYTTLYLRKRFRLENASELERLVFSIKADDGCIVYLNGVVILQARAPGGDVHPPTAVTSFSAREPLASDRVVLDISRLNPDGENVLAIQGFNQKLDSSDFSLLPQLYGIPAGSGKGGEAFLEEFQNDATAAERPALLAYLKGRLLQENGRHREAAEQFRSCTVLDPQRPEPILALGESLVALNRDLEASTIARMFLAANCPRARTAWDRWLELSLGVIAPRPTLSTLEKTLSCKKRSRGRFLHAPGPYVDEVRWLFSRLQENVPLRINVGGRRYRSSDGTIWSKDRFFLSGQLYGDGRETFDEAISGTNDGLLFQTERYFPADGNRIAAYRMPVPAGLYRVRLHMAEIYHRDTSRRAFDVVLESETVAEEFSPGAVGFATADLLEHELRVEDGLLNIDFIPRRDRPKLSALEIERLGPPLE